MVLLAAAGETTPASGAPPSANVAPSDRAVDPPILVTWTAPEECPPIDELRAEIRRLAGPVASPAERPEANATVRRAGKDSWLLTLTTRSGALGGQRKLIAADCGELMRATALVLALMINPNAVAPPPPPPPPPGPVGRFALGLNGFLGSGLLPGAVVPGVGLRIAWGREISIEVRGNLWLSRNSETTADPTVGGSFDLIDVGAGACVSARRDSRVSPGACLGGSVLRSEGRGFGVSNPERETAWWSGAYVEADVQLRAAPRHALRISVEAMVPLGRPTFALRGVGPVWQPSVFGARGTLGWELHF